MTLLPEEERRGKGAEPVAPRTPTFLEPIEIGKSLLRGACFIGSNKMTLSAKRGKARIRTLLSATTRGLHQAEFVVRFSKRYREYEDTKCWKWGCDRGAL